MENENKTRPWFRFLARSFDFILLSWIAIPFTFTITKFLLQSFIGVLFYAPVYLGLLCFIEAFFISTIATTPGKSLFNIEILKNNGSKLNYKSALKRSFLVWWRGLGTGFFIIPLFTQAKAYSDLKKNGATTWDRDLEVSIIHKEISFVRIIIIILIVLFFYNIYQYGKSCERNFKKTGIYIPEKK